MTENEQNDNRKIIAQSDDKEVRIEETATKYYVFLPEEYNELVEYIAGRKWNSELSCWIFPRESRTLNMLFAELGELVSSKLRRQTDAMSMEDMTLPGGGSFQKDQPQSDDVLISEDPNIAELKEQIKEKNLEIKRLQTELKQKEACIKNFSGPYTDLVSGTFEEIQARAFFNSLAKQITKNITNQDENFINFIDNIEIDNNFPGEVAKKLKRFLRDSLSTNQESKSRNDNADFYGLLKKAEHSKKYSQDVLDLAHIIRRQRNMIAHAPIASNTYRGRVLLVLFAYSVLFSYLTEENN